MKGMNRTVVVTLVALLTILGGCTKPQNPVGSNLSGISPGTQSVNMGVAFSTSGTASLLKTDGTFATDSLRIDSAIVVFQRIRFEPHIDSVTVDSLGDLSDHDADDYRQPDSLMFKGPFVVHVRDTSIINFANQVVPAGTYDGITFKIHKIMFGERCEDSDDFNRHANQQSNAAFMGSSIVVWGAVKRDSAWHSFAFYYNGELQVKIKETFVIASPTSSVNVALRFDLMSWFRNPSTGALLDPTDKSHRNLNLIDHAIRLAFQSGRGWCGRDWGWFPPSGWWRR
jgi:hypothetical protein